MNPLWPLDRLVTPLARRSVEAEKLLVAHPERARRAFLSNAALFAIAFGAFVVVMWTDPGPLRAVCSGIVGGFLGANSLAVVRRARAYRSGWIDGRVAMILSMQEATARGLSFQEWAEGELERDWPLLKGW